MCDCNKTYTSGNTSSMVAPQYRVVPSIDTDCDYTLEQINGFKDKIMCFKDKSLFKQYNVAPMLINQYLGILLSAINSFEKSPCIFKNELASIETFVLVINETNKC